MNMMNAMSAGDLFNVVSPEEKYTRGSGGEGDYDEWEE
jgi:hypothetical protein